jgi:hypothetical protein
VAVYLDLRRRMLVVLDGSDLTELQIAAVDERVGFGR